MQFTDNIQQHQAVIEKLANQAAAIDALAELMAERVSAGSTVFWLGNGGSAADAQHLAAELVGRFQLERPAIASMALHTDSSVMTALTNDYGYEGVFSRQLEAMCKSGDVVVGLSTSGNSVNVIHAIKTAKRLGALTIGFTGDQGVQLQALCDHCVMVPSSDTARIQEAHILVGHSLCQHIEQRVAASAVKL